MVGYTLYLSLIESLTRGKTLVSAGMRQEVERATHGINLAREGRRVCIISGGDPGVYGMAGLVLGLLGPDDFESLHIEIIPGVTAATTGAALLGAPLMHDFCVISLSDLMTDLELILSRVEHACKGDFVLVIYNPKGRTRIEPFRRTVEILLRERDHATPVGIVREATRGEESVQISSVGHLADYEDEIDMKTTIIVGNSRTRVRGGFLITPRGYSVEST